MDWVDAFFDNPLYDLEYAGVLGNTERTAREADFIVRELGLTPESRVMDLACGHGRHLVVIAPLVNEIVGIDRTRRFLDVAREAARTAGVVNATFIESDMRHIDADGTFDAAYNYFTAWGYYSDAENSDVLARVCRALKPGGRFLLEIIARDSLMRRFVPRDWHQLEDGTTVLEERWFDFATGREHSRRTYVPPGAPESRRVVEIDHRVPAPEDLLRMFREAGFVDSRSMSAPDGGPLRLDSPRLAVVGRRAGGPADR